MSLALRLIVALALALAASSAGAQSALAPDEVEVGFGTADVTPPVGVPLAGYSNRRAWPTQWFAGHPYAHYFEPSTGVHDPIEAHAMALVQGERRLVFLRLDLVAISTDLIRALLTRLADLKLSEDELIVTATHTHSGPGAWIDSVAWALIGTDRYLPSVLNGIVAGAERAVRQALDARAPARLFAVAFETEGLQVNRRSRGDPVDRTGTLLLARDRAGAWRGGLVNFAIHGTTLPASNLAFSADVSGAIEHSLAAALQERNGSDTPVTLLFLNGALGDVSPARRNVTGAERIANEFTARAKQALENAAAIAPRWSVQRTAVDLGAPYVTVKNCIRQNWLRWAAGTWLTIPLGRTVAREAVLRLVRLGDMILLTWPGEPTSALGLELRAAAMAAGSPLPMVLAISGDYKAYFTAPTEYARNSYESCMSWFGAAGGSRIVDAYRQLLAPPAR